MDAIEKRIIELIDAKREEIIAFGTDIFHHAEIGFKETRTAAKFAGQMEALGLDTQTGIAITGVKSTLPGQGPKVALMGELDALPISNAEHSNPETGAAHCCGHHAQLAGVVGAALALTDPEVRQALGGSVEFIGVPAEECVDMEFRENLAKEGKLRYYGGKCELLRLGALDDVDVVVGHHSTTDPYAASVANGSSNGFVTKNVRYLGKASHAAGAPHKGVDALAAAGLALHCIDAQRETFRDKDTVRIHGFISAGGEAANVVADNVTMQYLVRAGSIPAIKDASYKADRAFRAAAVATGCGLEIATTPGYLPTIPLHDVSVMEEAIDQATGGQGRSPNDMQPRHGTGSTDYGDISYVLPLLQFHTGGMGGQGHNPSYHVSDPETAYVLTAKIFALTAYKLLKDGGKAASDLAAGFTPTMTKQQYLEYMESMLRTETVELQPAPELE